MVENMLQMVAVLLSFGAIYAYIPVIIIVILIAAAAGLSRGTDIFAIFGLGTLIGAGEIRKGGFATAFRSKNNALARKGVAARMKARKGARLNIAKAANAGIFGRKVVTPPFRRPPGINFNALGRAAGIAAANPSRGFTSAYNKTMQHAMGKQNRLSYKVAPRSAAELAFSQRLAAHVAGEKAAASKPSSPGTTGGGNSGKMWSTRVSPAEYLLSSAKKMKEGSKWRSKTVIKPDSPEATVEMLTQKANPMNLQKNIGGSPSGAERGAASKAEARMYHREQQAAWHELIRRDVKENNQEAHKAVMDLVGTYGLRHPHFQRYTWIEKGEKGDREPVDIYANVAKASKDFDVNFYNYQEKVKTSRKDLAFIAKKKGKESTEYQQAAMKADSEINDLKKKMKESGWKSGVGSNAVGFAPSAKRTAKDSDAETSLTGGGWKKYYKDYAKEKKKERKSGSSGKKP